MTAICYAIIFWDRLEASKDLVFKYKYNLSNDVNESSESFRLLFFFPFFFSNEEEHELFRVGSLTLPFCPSLPYTPSFPSTLPKVISVGNLSLWRESRRHFRTNETKRVPISLARRIIDALLLSHSFFFFLLVFF